MSSQSSSVLNYLGLGALALFFASLWKNNEQHTRKVSNEVEQPPTIRDPIGGHSIFYGYFGRTNTAPILLPTDNKNSIL
jgi:hypothetical protein